MDWLAFSVIVILVALYAGWTRMLLRKMDASAVGVDDTERTVKGLDDSPTIRCSNTP